MVNARKRRDWACGAGAGAVTPDGCPVELYARLLPHDEPEIVHGAIPPDASILELGAGTGRVTASLVALGHEVVAVDESAEMLAHVRGAETVHAAIEDLTLPRRFDVVLLMSYLIDIPDYDLRRAWLRTCREHVAHDGRVVIQRHGQAWFDSVTPNERTVDGIVYRLAEVRRPGPDLLTLSMQYELGETRWAHTFTHRRMDDATLARVLAEAGLRVERTLSDNGSWVLARPGSGAPA